jgi:hypothetical protein
MKLAYILFVDARCEMLWGYGEQRGREGEHLEARRFLSKSPML